MEGPTSSGGLRNRLTCLTLQEHDDDEHIFTDLSGEIRAVTSKSELFVGVCGIYGCT